MASTVRLTPLLEQALAHHRRDLWRLTGLTFGIYGPASVASIVAWHLAAGEVRALVEARASPDIGVISLHLVVLTLGLSVVQILTGVFAVIVITRAVDAGRSERPWTVLGVLREALGRLRPALALAGLAIAALQVTLLLPLAVTVALALELSTGTGGAGFTLALFLGGAATVVASSVALLYGFRYAFAANAIAVDDDLGAALQRSRALMRSHYVGALILIHVFIAVDLLVSSAAGSLVPFPSVLGLPPHRLLEALPGLFDTMVARAAVAQVFSAFTTAYGLVGWALFFLAANEAPEL